MTTIKIYFQRFAGKHGSDGARGIADVEYVLRIEGTVVDQGKTATDGSITVNLPTGKSAELELFGTKYPLRLLGSIEPGTSTKGQQQRLSLLGYEPSSADGTLRKETDLASLQFQANTSLYPEGSLGTTGLKADTCNKLISEFGE
ncbi:hypothetical protein F0U62_45470 [Cystobacter fuscus]|uniref:hypothetical protein n=1 Tax=Cystobacter fuscus TaxID=43 RepID=UPI002B2E967E|nr:hypothetical protein F0U62_45470 [Cystobacter fuscus]